jgi:hypothetical protein
MEINTSDFNKPLSHPYGMAERYEYESLLAWMLLKIIDKGLNIEAAIELQHHHSDMVKAGYLTHHPHETDKVYSLTPKSIVLLHQYYGKKK